jgi:predicted Rossmann fold nucleotide-binding protein DprA/Smf involved in DNA uptake
MSAAEEAGGNAVGILADSLESAMATADTRRALMDGRVCLCTPYKPDARFNVGNAMGRNKIIYALSRVTLVVATARDSGGTWAGAKEALDKKYSSVAVWRGVGEGPGNEAIEKAGAIRITDVAELLDVDPLAHAGTNARQLSLIGPTSDRPTAAADNRLPATIEAEDDPAPPMPPLPGALRPEPTGVCWCGCGKTVDADEYFLPRHAPGAAQRALIKHFGSVEAFLLLMEQGPPTADSASTSGGPKAEPSTK